MMDYKDFPRPLSDRTPIGDFKMITDFASEMLKKWQKGRAEHGIVIRIDPLEEAMKECLDLANYAMDSYYRIERLKEALRSDKCVKCGRHLVIPQHLDYVETDKGKFCMSCEGGS